ncbi:YciI family protein [Tabrizicola sp. J26]|uniref:YciI family protein n=1 Tax=Alitabrizicola rongguiensis TaxID=2909234 RepID=UPI001F271B0A|nr:YciI family protein [Tabrizicola rongguiensis]MCF1710134.1 YciI family protein [Tabrizicola rongguiensis]
MQYMALIYTDPAKAPEMGEKMNGEYFELTKRMREAGVMRAGDALHPVSSATSVRVRGGKVETMDGPFAETKEHLGGYYLIDCADLDEAIKWAAQIPGAQFGTVELRPVVVFR